MTQQPFDFSGERQKDIGQTKAIEHAGREWLEKAVKSFAAFVRDRGEATMEQWRHDWLARGGEAPATHKVYGAVATVAARRKLVVNTGRYVRAVSEKTHAHPVPIWRPACPDS